VPALCRPCRTARYGPPVTDHALARGEKPVHYSGIMSIFKTNDTVLFQGDSITDAGRRDDPLGLGSGYAAMAAGLATAARPDLGLRFINRGVGGDRTVELLARWKPDCEVIRPDILSIKIGVNDVWRYLGEWEGQTFVDAAEYRTNLVRLLDRALAAGVRTLVLCSPTTIENNRNPLISEMLAERRDIVRALAAEYRAVYVPMQETQLALLAERSDIAWTLDGCHLSTAGHAVLAKLWVDTVLSDCP